MHVRPRKLGTFRVWNRQPALSYSRTGQAGPQPVCTAPRSHTHTRPGHDHFFGSPFQPREIAPVLARSYLTLRRRLFAADGAGMCWTFDALARWLARRARLGSPEGRAGGQLSPQRSIDNSMTAQKQLQGSMNRLNDSPTIPPPHRRRARFLLAASDAHAHTRHYRARPPSAADRAARRVAVVMYQSS